MVIRTDSRIVSFDSAVVGYPAHALIPRDFMHAEEEHVAHPRLYGAPAYARPPLRITPTVLPADPDDLPIAAVQTASERHLAERLLARPFGVAERLTVANPEPHRRSQPLRLGTLVGRILRRAS